MILCGREGNRRSGIALDMHHRLRGLSTYGLNDQCAGSHEHSHLRPTGARSPLPYVVFTILLTVCVRLSEVSAIAFPFVYRMDKFKKYLPTTHPSPSSGHPKRTLTTSIRWPMLVDALKSIPSTEFAHSIFGSWRAVWPPHHLRK